MPFEKTRGEMFHFFLPLPSNEMLIQSFGNLQTLELGIVSQSHFSSSDSSHSSLTKYFVRFQALVKSESVVYSLW